MNKQIQESNKIRQMELDETNKLMTMFQFARRFREAYKGLSTNFPLNLNELKADFEKLEGWQLPFEILIFEKTKPKNKTVECKESLSFLRQTKRNLRFALKDQVRATKLNFQPVGIITDNGKISPPYKTEAKVKGLSYGVASTSQIYSNSIIQDFFEFSLKYSYTKHIELSFEEARRIFLRACNTSLNIPLETESETKSFTEFIDFIYQKSSVFNSINLPTYKPGRPKGKQTNKIQAIEKLIKQGKKDREIIKIISQNFFSRSRNKKVEEASIGRAIRRIRNKKNGHKL